MPELADTMKHIVPMVDGPKGLSSRVKTLEMQILNASAVALPTKGVRLFDFTQCCINGKEGEGIEIDPPNSII